MNRQEAAACLGVSMRTLDRLVAEGRLKRGRARRKTRPIVVFDPGEVEALKVSLRSEIDRAAPFRRLNTPPKGTVGFRLDPQYFARLSKQAGAMDMSAGEYARTLVIRSLEDTRVEQFKDEVTNLREALAQMFYALLVMKLGISEVEAQTFIQETLRRR